MKIHLLSLIVVLAAQQSLVAGPVLGDRAVPRAGSPAREIATFGAGCFWGVEAAFRELPGVTDTVVGFMGGTTRHPSYESVCTHRTGHAEVCQVTFDPTVVSYAQLVEFFFKIHDPTTENRQGPDTGSQYRSVLFFHNPGQERAAHAVIAQLQAAGKFPRPIVTQVVAATDFWRAEEYHQRYFEKNHLPSCHVAH